MKPFIVLIFLSLSITALCQDLSNLDNKMGFNKFKLESSYDLYKSQLNYRLTGQDKVIYYDYNGNDINSVFNVFVKRINLGFYKNMLYTISIDFITVDKEDETILQNELQELFGRQRISYNSSSSIGEYDWAMQWESKNVILQLDKISCNNNSNPCEVELFMLSKKLKIEIKNVSF